jgi:hypothetical protein
LETYFRHVKPLVLKSKLFSCFTQLINFLNLLFRKVRYQTGLVFCEQCVFKRDRLFIFPNRKTVYNIINIVRNRFKIEREKISTQIVCLTSITYGFHLAFVLALPGIDSFLSPTNILIGLLKSKMGWSVAFLLCFICTVDNLLVFNIGTTLVLIQTYPLGNPVFAIVFLLLVGTFIRLGQSVIWYKGLKRWLI